MSARRRSTATPRQPGRCVAAWPLGSGSMRGCARSDRPRHQPREPVTFSFEDHDARREEKAPRQNRRSRACAIRRADRRAVLPWLPRLPEADGVRGEVAVLRCLRGCRGGALQGGLTVSAWRMPEEVAQLTDCKRRDVRCRRLAQMEHPVQANLRWPATRGAFGGAVHEGPCRTGAEPNWDAVEAA